MLNKKGILFSTLSIVFIVLFIGLTLSFSKYNYFYNSQIIDVHKTSTDVNSINLIDSSIEKYFGINYVGIRGTNTGYYYYFDAVTVPDSFDNSFYNYINTTYLPNYGKSLTINTSRLDIEDIYFSSSKLNQFDITQNNFKKISSISFDAYLNFDATAISLISSPFSDDSGTVFNFNIYDNSSTLVRSISVILNQTDSSQVFEFLVSIHAVKFLFENSILSFDKSNDFVELIIKELKYEINN